MQKPLFSTKKFLCPGVGRKKRKKMIHAMKRAMALVVTAALLLLLLPCAFAAGAPEVQGAAVRVRAGETVDFSVTISGNTGLTGFMIYVSCDTDIFALDYDTEKASYEVTAGEKFQNGSILCAKNGTKGWIVTWVSSTPVSADGEMFRLRFAAQEGAEAGEYPIALSYSAKNTLDSGYTAVALDCVNGSVSVAPQTGLFRLGDSQAVPGGDLNLTVYVDKNPGLAACKLYIDCDPTVYTADYIGETLQCSVTAGTVARGGNLICSRNGSKGYQVVWQTNTDTLECGAFFTLPLHVSAAAQCGEASITLRTDAANLLNEKAEAVTAEAISGTVRLRECLTENLAYAAADGLSFDLCVAQGQSVTLICAGYSQQGKLLALKSASYTGPYSGTETIPLSENAASVRLFALKDKTWVPILPATEQ